MYTTSELPESALVATGGRAGARIAYERAIDYPGTFRLSRVFTRTVDVHIAGLRHKLEADPREPAFIQTVQRLGYKFVPRP